MLIKLIELLCLNYLDKNECDDGVNPLGTHNCDGNATCTNTEGSYSCECNGGYTGDGTSCDGNLKCIPCCQK